ncbi:lipocalin family protein [Chitinibacter bivalviorum]|uniref:Outer membrane lipoprotein Blc n=1 Tax=Chitinibacter bivalviorum TaxID=2739434 RepID=A0A7H9BMM3_9NEIS|nr:lipocalin family protein [Chitinibacter bivalviorum]
MLICAALCSPAFSLAEAETPAEVRSVAAVDLSRYVGQWYEIAKFPMFFQRNCVADTTANYSSNPDGSIKVVNRCRTESGEFDQAEGKATVVENTHNSQLKVSFFWPFKADYWVIGLDPAYRWAVVGNPNRKYLWILSRTPQLADSDLAAAQIAATAQGYDLRNLDYTKQSKP